MEAPVLTDREKLEALLEVEEVEEAIRILIHQDILLIGIPEYLGKP